MNNNIKECIKQSAEWLASIQNSDGGWGQTEGSNSNVLNTAEAILSLIDSDLYNPGDKIIQDGIKFLFDEQLVTNEYCGAWGRKVQIDHNNICLPDTIRTAFALLALNKAGVKYCDENMMSGVKWLTNNQFRSGGWGYTLRKEEGKEQELFPTSMAVRALFRIYKAGDNTIKTSIQNGLDALVSYDNNDGSFGRTPRLITAHTLNALITLQEAKKYNFPVNLSIDKSANWIQEHKNSIITWEEESVNLSQNDKELTSYPFSHINAALYLRLVDKDNKFIDQGILRECLIQIYENQDNKTFGFTAKRPVSWVTSKTLLGLTKITFGFTNFPEREIISSADSNKRTMAYFSLLILVIIAAILTFFGKMSMEFALIIFAVILAVLLLFDFLSRKDFVSILEKNPFKK